VEEFVCACGFPLLEGGHCDGEQKLRRVKMYSHLKQSKETRKMRNGKREPRFTEKTRGEKPGRAGKSIRGKDGTFLPRGVGTFKM